MSTWIVLGNGPSVNDYDVDQYLEYPTIGVNQIARKFDPDYVTLLDPPTRFGKDGLHWARISCHNSIPVVERGWRKQWRAFAPEALFRVFQFINMPTWSHYLVEDYRRVKKRWASDKKKFELPFGPTSTGVAVWMAILHGAKDVGVVGLDYTKGYFYDSEKVFVKTPGALEKSDLQWAGMHRIARDVFSVTLWNLSKNSNITTLPKARLEDM